MLFVVVSLQEWGLLWGWEPRCQTGSKSPKSRVLQGGRVEWHVPTTEILWPNPSQRPCPNDNTCPTKIELQRCSRQASRNASVVGGGGGRAVATVAADVDNSIAKEEEGGDETLIQQPLVRKISSLLTVTSSRRRNKK